MAPPSPTNDHIAAALADADPALAAWLSAHDAEVNAALSEARNIPSYEIGRKSWDTSSRAERVKVGDTVEIPGRGAAKRYAVSAMQWTVMRDNATIVPLMVALPLSGEQEFALFNLEPGMHGGIMRRVRFDVPVFYGKQAKARYEDLVKSMTARGNARLIPPFQSAPDRPDEPEPPPPPSDTATPEEADVAIRHTVQDGTTADWDQEADRGRGRDKSVYHVLRSAGFVQAHQAGGVWRRTNSVGLEETRAPIRSIVDALHARGFTVYLDLQKGETAEALRRKREYLEERAARMAARGTRLSEEAERRLGRAADQADEDVRRLPIPGYFPTPPDIARKVVEIAQVGADSVVLDPSAGHGALIRAVREAAPDAEVDAVEINGQLRGLLAKQGIPVVSEDIFDPEFQPGTMYDKIVMNPPYEEGATIAHVQRAYEFLAPGGTLVAVVPESIRYRQDKKHAAFREWLAEHGAAEEDLDRARFGRAADIKTFILTLHKPDDAEQVEASQATTNRISLARADAEQAVGREAAAASQDVRDRISALMRRAEMSDRGGERLSKAEAAELRALRQKAQADAIAARARRIRASASRKSAVDVSKGGRSAQAGPSRAGAASQPTGMAEELRDKIRGIKSKVGAVKIERGWQTGCKLQFWLRWERESKRYSMSVDIEVLGGRTGSYKDCTVPSPTAFVVKLAAVFTGDPPVDTVIDAALGVDGVYARLVEFINAQPSLIRFKEKA